MELFAARGYFFCRYCGSFDFPETATDQGVRVLGELPGADSCVVCRHALAAALLDEAHPVQFCRNCRGVLMPRGTFADVVRLRRAYASGPPAAPVPLQAEDLRRRSVYPPCTRPLDTHPCFGPGNVVIDSCSQCDVGWLDFGELKQIVDAPGRDRGGRERAALQPDTALPGGPTPGRVLATPADDDEARSGVDLLGAIASLLSR